MPKENATILKNVISISANGANTGATFYQPHEFCILQDAYAIEFIGDKKLNDKEYLFLYVLFQKLFIIIVNTNGQIKQGGIKLKTS